MTNHDEPVRRGFHPMAARFAAASMVLIGVTGCGIIGGITRTTSIELQNDADYPVEVDLYIYDEQLAPLPLILADGEHIETTLAVGARRVFVRSCDDLQAAVIADADLRIAGSIGPSAATGVLRDGHDFSCGSRIIFRFNHGNLILDFDIDTTVVGD